jgi:DNA transformation protein
MAKVIFNRGSKSSEWLADVGITTLDQVVQMGVIPVCLRVKAAGHPVSLNLAYALQGAIIGVPWNALPPPIREDLQTAYRAAFQRTKH